MTVSTATTDPMLASARITFVVQVSKFTRATPSDQTQHSFVLNWHPRGKLGQVTVRMLPQRFCDRRHRSLPGFTFAFGIVNRSEPVVEQVARLRDLVELLTSVLFGIVGQVQIDQRGLQVAVTEKLLNPPQ